MKRVVFVFAALVLSIGMWAKSISEQEAQKRVLQFITERAPAMARGQKASALKAKLKVAQVEVSGLYVFNCEGGGFVIASGDDRTVPILGYSDQGIIDWQNMPENMRAWLKGYGEAIASLGSVNLSPGELSRAIRQPIAPLLTTQWDQYEPYWNDCPDVYGGRALTGCVATAMAQVMNYHRWPQSACEKIPAHTFPDRNGDITLEELPPTIFDWEHMDSNMEEVAKLMRYCGQSVRMQYASGESSSDGMFVGQALRHYFDYDPGTTGVVRAMYGVDEWEQLIYDELAGNRPVIYCGQSKGGHCFVCDGYDENGLFHINWGWSGKSDGWFSLSILNPYDTSGAGASSSQLGYCMLQQAVLGVQPPTGQSTPSDESPRLYVYENMYISDNTVKINALFEDLLILNATFEMALGTMGSDGVLTPLVMAEKSCEIESPFAGDFDIVINNEKLAAGTYQLLPMARCISTDGDWHLVTAPEKKIQVVVNDEGVTCQLLYLPDLSIEKGYINIGSGIAAEPNEVTLVVNNKGHEYSGNLRVRYLYLGSKTAKETFDDLPPISEMEDGGKIGGYFRAESTEKLLFPFYSLSGVGNYLFLLYEDKTDVLMDTTTVQFDKDYVIQFIDLEVTSYKLQFDEDYHFTFEVTIKNNDPVNNWPQYNRKKDVLNVEYFDYIVGGGSYPSDLKVASGGEAVLSGFFEDIDLSEPEKLLFFIEEKLSDGQVKRIFEKEINYGETLTYPEATGVSSVSASDSHSQSFFDLQGRMLKGQPVRGGVYIHKNRKVVIP